MTNPRYVLGRYVLLSWVFASQNGNLYLTEENDLGKQLSASNANSTTFVDVTASLNPRFLRKKEQQLNPVQNDSTTKS